MRGGVAATNNGGLAGMLAEVAGVAGDEVRCTAYRVHSEVELSVLTFKAEMACRLSMKTMNADGI